MCWVAGETTPQQAYAFIHVADENVDIQVGDRTFHIAERWYTPIQCELPAGRHTLVMTRGGQVLCREEFARPWRRDRAHCVGPSRASARKHRRRWPSSRGT
jgi:hypothetical protein